MLNFKKIRKEKNYTQSEFAEKIGISTRALSNYENGNIDISLKKMQEIADLLNINISDLLDVNLNTVNEPADNYEKSNKNLNVLQENVNLLRELNSNKEEVIILLKQRVEFLEKELQPFRNVVKEIEEKHGSFEKFIEAANLLIEVETKIEEIENNKKLNNDKKRGTA